MVERFAYVIAFNGDKFVMVRHRERAWEMPGGRLVKCETHEQAAVREFFEETGMSLELIGSIRIAKPGGKVFVGLVRGKLSKEHTEYNIVEVKEFTELPDLLSFPLVEYEMMLVQARMIVETFKRGNNIDGSASPLNK
ncbi:MAG: NUDIX domain-containing protein [Thermoplasmatota archaeon]|nr:NUDIX domain-containing protein [Candidatus Thermoplasmatota archaeon]MBU1913975.1 NUDIX domain-containing protein [Candidatus Thermoplasmatota archaeon]